MCLLWSYYSKVNVKKNDVKDFKFTERPKEVLDPKIIRGGMLAVCKRLLSETSKI